MLDIKFVRENPEAVKENLKKKFQDEKIPMVDEVIKLDEEFRTLRTEGDELRGKRNKISKEIGMLIGQKKMEEAEKVKAEVKAINDRITEIDALDEEKAKKIREIMLVIPQMIADDVPIGKDDSENVEIEKFGEPVVPDYEIPYHVDIMESFDGIDLDAARRTSGAGFYYLKGDMARLHSAILSYARDFMIDKGYTYYIPPYMVRSDVVTGVMKIGRAHV